MTWTKLGDEFSDEARDLTDAEFRTYVEALNWSNRRMLDLRIPKRDLRRFAESAQAQAAAAGLVAKGWWDDRGDHWYVDLRFPEWQLERAVVEKRRSDAAQRQRRKRLHDAGDHSACTERCSAVTRDGTRDGTRDPGRVGSGRVTRTEGPVKAAAPGGASRAPEVAEQRRAAEGGTRRYEPAPSHSQSEHDGSDNSGPDDQQIPAVVHLQSQAADRYAREASAADARDAADWARDHPGVPMRPRNCMTCWEPTDSPGRCAECRAKLAAAGMAS